MPAMNGVIGIDEQVQKNLLQHHGQRPHVDVGCLHFGNQLCPVELHLWFGH